MTFSAFLQSIHISSSFIYCQSSAMFFIAALVYGKLSINGSVCAVCRHEGGIVSRATPRKWSEQDDYEQPKALWLAMSPEDQEMTAKNIAGHIQGAKDFIIQRQIGVFRKCDESLAKKVEEALGMKKKSEEPYTMMA